MKRLLIMLLMVCAHALSLSAQNCYRFHYLQSHKRSQAENNFSVNEMRLDFDGTSAFFYNEVSFKRDSLNVIAFGKNGNIINEEAYGERTRLPGKVTNDKSVVDFSSAIMSQYYTEIAFFEGSMPLELPQWDITEEEEEQSGYRCKKAEGKYLGRDWTIWFTEEIPVNVGPWLLWGAPGLIVYAKDSENVLSFRLSFVEKIAASRLSQYLSYKNELSSRPRAKVYSMSMKDMEIMHNKYKRDVEFFNRIHGISGGYIEDRNGQRSEMTMTRPYFPYISDDYWNNK